MRIEPVADVAQSLRDGLRQVFDVEVHSVLVHRTYQPIIIVAVLGKHVEFKRGRACQNPGD